MKIQIVSDTHNDLRRFTPNKDVDLIVHAGDFNTGAFARITPIEDFVNLCASYNKECVFVLGNHDYYGHNFYNSFIEKECYKRGYNLLTINNSFKYKGFEFIGSIFGTDFKLPGIEYFNTDLIKIQSQRNITDFYEIYANDSLDVLFTPDDYIKEFNRSLEYIESYRYKENIVLVTHFPLSNKCLDPRYKDSPLNPYFINDIDLNGFLNVISGHTHTTIIDKIENTNIYINAYGYSNKNNFECLMYESDFIIEI